MIVAVTRSILPVGLDLLRRNYDVRIREPDPDAAAITAEEIIEFAGGADALITMLSDPISARVFEGCRNLKIVAQYAVGFDNIDLEAARSHGVIVTNTPGVLTDATADFAFTLLLAVTRRVIEADQFARAGKFKRWETQTLLGIDLKGKTLGIVGLGRIGQAMALRAKGFGMQLIYFDRSRKPEKTEEDLGIEFTRLEDLLERSDILSLHCPLNAESRHMLNRSSFDTMKEGAFIINTARGALIDEESLVDVLNSGRIAGAGLDVYEMEPRIHPGLFEHPRVVLAPHIASATIETRIEMGRMCSASVHAVLSGAREIPFRVV